MHRGRDASFPLVVVADIAARWPEVPPPPCGEQFGPSRRGAMQPWQALAWYRRMSLVYGLGAWTVFGTMFYFYGKNKEEPLGRAVWRDSGTFALRRVHRGRTGDLLALFDPGSLLQIWLAVACRIL